MNSTPPALRSLAAAVVLLWCVGCGVLALGAVWVTLYELYPWLHGALP